WATRKQSTSSSRPVIVLGHADPRSCVVTGAHRMSLPTAGPGPARGLIGGVCDHCGLEKSYPATHRWKKDEKAEAVAPRFDLAPAASSATSGSSWDACLDALVHLGGGSIGALERIAGQAEGSSLFADHFLRTLEGLGHIDVRRDERFQPIEWEANPAFLAETIVGSFVLAGVWSASLRNALEEGLQDAGGSLDRSGGYGSPSIWAASGVSAETLSEIADRMGDVYVVPDAVNQMLACLPPLSSIEASLAEIPIPDYAKASIFDPNQASWVAVPGVGAPGAYRLEQSFRSSTIWVSADGALRRTAKPGGIQLVKHLAARAESRPLLGHLESSNVLIVPLGADLPGVYGRVAMLCSGTPPMVSKATRSLGYAGVPKHVADRLNTLLAS
ncbi:hypothetical protein, partial [Burkholderia cenocepacia]|uniref:hypothetical protein n=1 Tax=Burkholderia cenocepacia TaxID=95486 RepID=UPI0038CBF3D9